MDTRYLFSIAKTYPAERFERITPDLRRVLYAVFFDNELLSRLKESVCICRGVKQDSRLKRAAYAKFNRIEADVVMCPKCNSVYKVALEKERISLAKKVTNQYPWIDSSKKGI